MPNPLARLLRPRMRAVLASLMVVFVLVTAAHFSHQHEPASDRTASHHLCGFCIGFGSAADTPREHAGALRVPVLDVVLAFTTQPWIGGIVHISARPRAPPLG